jgi:HK97 family phage prohead protease
MKEIKQKFYKDFNIEIKSTEDDKNIIECIGSYEAPDRDGDIVKIDGIDLGNFKKNPVILWAHDYWSLPIGKSLKTWKHDKSLKFQIEFTKEETYPFGNTVYKLYRDGFLKSFSIGFRPDVQFAKFNDKRNGYDFEKVELIELSCCAVPSNINAVLTDVKMQDAIKNKSFTQEEITSLEEFLKKVEKEQEPKVEEVDVVKLLTTKVEDLEKKIIQLQSDLDVITEHNNENRSTDNYIEELLSEDLGLSGQMTLEKDSKNQPQEEDFEDFCKQLLVKK